MTDFELWQEELVTTTYLHECPDGGSTTTVLTGSNAPEAHVDPQRCVGCGEQPMFMRAIAPAEAVALEAGLWPGVPT